jgi:hypothetical protein
MGIDCAWPTRDNTRFERVLDRPYMCISVTSEPLRQNTESPSMNW